MSKRKYNSTVAWEPETMLSCYSSLNRLDIELIIAILEFVITNDDFSQIVYLKRVNKLFNSSISSPMFGRLVGFWSRVENQEIWNLPYTTINGLTIEAKSLKQLKESSIQNIDQLNLEIDVHLLQTPFVKANFLTSVDRFQLEFFDSKDGKSFKEKIIVHLPKKIRGLYIDPPDFDNVDSRIEIAGMEGGYGIESLDIWTGMPIDGSILMWRHFFRMHQQTLKTVTINHGVICSLNGMFPFASFFYCYAQYLKICITDWDKTDDTSKYAIDITMFPCLRKITINIFDQRDAIPGTEFHITLSTSQAEVVKIRCSQLFVLTKTIVDSEIINK